MEEAVREREGEGGPLQGTAGEVSGRAPEMAHWYVVLKYSLSYSPLKLAYLANPYFNKLLINAKFNLISKSAALIGVASFSLFLNVLYSLIH